MPRNHLFLPWLIQSLNDKTFPGLLDWLDEEKSVFRVLFQHGNSRRRGQRTQTQAAAVWTAWAHLKNSSEDKVYGCKKSSSSKGQWLTTCRQRFRQALRSLIKREYLEKVPSSTAQFQNFRILKVQESILPEDSSLPTEKSSSESGFQLLDSSHLEGKDKADFLSASKELFCAPTGICSLPGFNELHSVSVFSLDDSHVYDIGNLWEESMYEDPPAKASPEEFSTQEDALFHGINSSSCETFGNLHQLKRERLDVDTPTATV